MQVAFDSWHLQQMLGLIFLIFIIVSWYVPHIGRLNCALWMAVLISGTVTAFFPQYLPDYLTNLMTDEKIKPFIPELANKTQWSAAQSIILAIIMPLGVYAINKKQLEKIFIVGAFIESMSYLVYEYTFFLGSTFSASISALGLLLTWNLERGLYFFLSLAFVMNILFNGGSTAWAIVAVGLLWHLRRYLILYWFYFLATVLSMLCIFWNHISNFMNGNGRYEMWQVILTKWSEHMPWYGIGMGSWDWVGLFIYKQPNGVAYLWPHNDFIQVLCEGGPVILILLIAVIIRALYRLRNDSQYFALGLAYVVFMFSYYPSHWFLTQMLGLLILKESLKLKSN